MKIEVTCDRCGKTFMREPSQLKGKKHCFCSRQCLAEFSNKTKNPEGYRDLKDFTNISAHMSELNRTLNPQRMTDEVKDKLRQARLNTGEAKSYRRIYGAHEHRIVAELFLGRALQNGEVVHHINGDKRDNRPENLQVLSSQSEHAKLHAKKKEVMP